MDTLDAKVIEEEHARLQAQVEPKETLDRKAGVPVRVRGSEAGFVNVRASPSTEAPALTQVGDGTVLEALEPEENVWAKVGVIGEWFHIRTPDGIEGYVRAPHLTFPVESAEAPAPADPALYARYTAEGGPRSRWAPVIAGVGFSSAATSASALTVTALVTDNETGQALVLLPGWDLQAGDQIIQPAGRDGGVAPGDVIAEVTRVVFNERCVAAVARITGGRDLLTTLPDGNPVTGVVELVPGMRVWKYGCTTGLTTSRIHQYDVTSRIDLGERGDHIMRDLFMTLPISSGADTGALVVDEANQAVGVIVAFSETLTLCIPISTVLKELGVSLITEPALVTCSSDLAAINDLVFGVPDKLGFTDYVDAFVRLIYDSNTRPPLAIGIYGAWGSGKSFLMNKIQEELRQRMTADVAALPWWKRPLHLSPTKLPIIWFDAWAYNASDKLWAGLVQEIFQGLERSGLGWWGQIRLNFKRNLEREIRALHAKLLPYTLIAILASALAIGFILTDQTDWATAVLTPVGLATLLASLRKLVDIFRVPASDRIVRLFAQPDYTKDLGFMWRIRDDLESFSDNLPSGMKVVVFIDDLDRCDPEKAVEVLEAIKLILDLNRFIVFLGLDARVITQAVEEHYGKVLAEAGITGYEYLDKIVQIPFSIPDANPDEISSYLGYLVGMNDKEVQAIRLTGQRSALVLERVQEAVPAESPPVGTPAPTSGAVLTEEPVSQKATAQPIASMPAPTSTGESPPTPSEPRLIYTDAEVSFTETEQTAFLTFADHLIPNPRRLKRLVNIYRLVRALAMSKQVDLIYDRPQIVLQWLILCEQWPYAMHLMLEGLDKQLKQVQSIEAKLDVLQTGLPSLHASAKSLIDNEGNPDLMQLDMDYELLADFVATYGHALTAADIQRLRPFTVNFNPALTAEVQRSL